jgi:hypothetical protein
VKEQSNEDARFERLHITRLLHCLCGVYQRNAAARDADSIIGDTRDRL